MRIKLTSIMVDNQDKALKFYTETFDFKKKHEIPVGEYRWLTVVSPEGPDDIELSLEPNANPAGKTFQEAIFKQGIPAAAFEVADLEMEVKRLQGMNVLFTQGPTKMGPSRSPCARIRAAISSSSISDLRSRVRPEAGHYC